MSDTKGSGTDPSMDDILASIRKIISDDEARAQGNAAVRPESGQGASSPPAAAGHDDVLLLTELVDEPKGAASPITPPAKTDPTLPRSAAPVQAGSGATPADQSLVEPGAAGLAASAFDRLSQAVQESVPRPVVSDPGPNLGPSGRSLEDIVKELLRPMLKEWLDKNLPAMVERSVEREIVRLTRR